MLLALFFFLAWASQWEEHKRLMNDLRRVKSESWPGTKLRF